METVKKMLKNAIIKVFLFLTIRKINLFLVLFCCLPLVQTSRAQSDGTLPTNEEMYILDGKKNDFAYGRYLTPNQIAIGLSDEGVYELRNDTAVWLVSHPVMDETVLVTVREEKESGNLFFLFTLPDGAATDTIGVFDPERNEIFDKSLEPLASVDISNNRILSRQAETLLLVHFPAVNRRLAVFFFLHHCLPIKQQGII